MNTSYSWQPGWGRGRGWGRKGGRGGWGRRGGGPPWVTGMQPMQQPQLPQIPPPPPGAIRVAVSTDDNAGLESHVSQVFARSPYVLFIDIVNGSVTNIYPIQNPYAMGGGGAGIAFAQFIIGSGARVVIASSIGMNVSSILSQYGIQVYNVPPGTRVVDALRSTGLIR
jgi:predicted Fe-Mo cluster-binding NifX family protein